MIKYGDKIFNNLKIFVISLATISAFVGVLIFFISGKMHDVEHIKEATMRKKAYIERVNGLVYAVVMESRGLYMAETPARIEQFGKGLEAHLVSLKRVEDAWRKDLLDDKDRAEFSAVEAQIDAFIKLRTELVSAARAGGASAAKEIGDNDANRKTRTALNQTMDAFIERYTARWDRIDAESEQGRLVAGTIIGVVIGLIVLLTLLLVRWIHRSIAMPFETIAQEINKITAGETEFQVSRTDQNNEIGQIARALDQFRLAEVERHDREAKDQLTLHEQMEQNRKLSAAIERFEFATAQRVSELANTSSKLFEAATALSTGAEETARQAEIVTEAANELNVNLGTVASSGQELAEAVVQIAQSMETVNATSQHAYVVNVETTAKFAELAEAVSTIGQVVGLINSIAAKTNLLALNATIEAARAGDAGRGFAVVASEVKELASQTTLATAEIATSIAHIQSVTEQSLESAKEIGGTIEKMRNLVMNASAAVEQQRDLTRGIAENVQGASAGTEQVSSNIFGVSQAADDTGIAATKVLQSAGHLSREAEAIQKEVHLFISELQAA